MPRGGLWQHSDFMRLWIAQAISAYGARITRTALPIIAIGVLDQPESVIGALVAAQLAPGVVLALFVGGWIDRGNKRRILIGADLVRAAAIASLTIAWVAGSLSMAHVFVVGAIVGAASGIFAMTDNAFLPEVIERKDLGEGNAKLEATEAIAEITGPASAGALIAALGAPLAVAIDAVTYVWSAVWLMRVRTRVAEPSRFEVKTDERSPLRSDLEIGMRAVFGHPIVRRIVLSHMVWSLSGGFFIALYTPYCLRELNLDETSFGIVIAMGGVGALGGALFSRVSVQKFGLGPTLVLASALSLSCAVFIPLARGPYVMVMALLIAHQIFSDGFSVAFVIQAVTLRQTVLPHRLLGRANAAIHVCTSSLLPIGALIAGFTAEAIGTRSAVWIGVSVGLIPPLILWPLRTLRELPPSPDASP